MVDRTGIPLAVRLSAANARDATRLLPLLDAIPPIIGPRGKPGRPRFRPAKLHADKGYDHPVLRRALRARGITPRIARRGPGGSSSGRFRGCRAAAGWGCATNGGQICSRAYSTSPVPWSASASSAQGMRDGHAAGPSSA